MHSVIAAVQPIVFVYQLSPCWARTVKTQVNGWLWKSVLHHIEPQFPWPIMHHDTITLAQSWWKETASAAAAKETEEAVMAMSMRPQSQLVHMGSSGPFWRALSAICGKIALTYHKTFLAHSAKQLPNRQISLMMMHLRHIQGLHLGQGRLTLTQAV